MQRGLLKTGPGQLLRPFCFSGRSALALEWAALSLLRLFPSGVRAGWCPIQGQPPASCLESQGPTHLTPSFRTDSAGPEAKCLGADRKQWHCWVSMVRAERESYISAVNQHLGDYDPRGSVSLLLAHPHGATGGPAAGARQRPLGTRLPDGQVPWIGARCWMARTAISAPSHCKNQDTEQLHNTEREVQRERKQPS